MVEIAAQRHSLSVFGVVRQGQTYRNLLYLFLTFPLGIAYFTLLVTLIATSVSLLVIGVGILLLALTMVIWWGLAEGERHITMALLGVKIIAPPAPAPAGATLFARLRAYLTYEPTWRRLIFLFARFPLGILYFVLMIVSLTLGLALALEPLAYLLTAWIMHIGGFTGAGMTSTIWGQFIVDDGTVRWNDVLLLLPSVPVGIAILIGSFHGLNGLAWLDGRFATYMLGARASELQLAEARAAAERASARAAVAEQSQRDLIVNASHELRTPLASIRAHVDALTMVAGSPDTLDPEQLRRYLAVVGRESERMSDLVDDLLLLAQGEMGKIPLSIALVDVGEVAREVCDALTPMAERERKIQMLCQIEPVEPVWADRLRLSQILLNLMRNGILYTPEGGIVVLSVNQRDAGGSISPSPTPGSALPLRIFPTSLTAFTARMPHAHAPRADLAWDSPSRTISSN